MSKIKRIPIKLSKTEMNRLVDLIDDYTDKVGFRDGRYWKIYNDIQEKFKEKIKLF